MQYLYSQRCSKPEGYADSLFSNMTLLEENMMYNISMQISDNIFLDAGVTLDNKPKPKPKPVPSFK
jgi:hypothetical protein